MSNIRNFHVVKGKKDDTENFTAKIKKYRWKSFLRRAIGLAVIAGLVSVLIIYYKNQVFTNMVVVNQIEHNTVTGTSYLSHDGNIVTYSKDGISSMDSKGKALWNMTYEMQSPIVRMAKGVVAVGDYNGHMIYLIDSKGNANEIDTNLPIRDFCVSEDEIVAVILEDSTNSWIDIFSKTGEKIVDAKATMTKTGYPLAVALSGEVMGVSYFYVGSDTIKSSVTFYNFGGVGENSSDHIVSSYDYANAVVPTVKFLSDGSSFAVADNRLMFFASSKKPTSIADILLEEEIQGIYYGDTYVGLVFFDATGEHKYRMDLYHNDGKKQLSYSFDIDFKDILVQKEDVVIYNEAQCIMVGMNGKEKYIGSFSEGVNFMAASESARKYILMKERTVDTVELK